MSAAEEGYAMPPEWAPQEAVWFSWPVADPRHWGGAKRDRIDAAFAAVVAAASHFETVRVNIQPGDADRVRDICNRARADLARLELFEHPHDDVWCRDHGPIFLKHRDTGAIAVSDWVFNAWGGKFPPWDADDRVPGLVADALGLPRFEGGMVLEGGAIEINGTGQLLTTEAVLLNPNRNPHLSRGEIEDRLRTTLGVREILWLEKGIAGDDTDGHIDDLARFTDDTTIVASTEDDAGSPNAPVLAANLARLRDFRTPAGRPFEVVPMPMPDPCTLPGWRLPILPASYVNFLVLNHAVLVPAFRQRRNDDRAAGILRELFPDREVIGLDCLDLVEEGGALHCISQQQPG